MYYCWKCRAWHKSGSIARRHKIFSVTSKSKRQIKPRVKPKPLRILRPTKKIKEKYGLTITKKIKPVARARPSEKRAPLRKAKTGLSLTSKTRRGQIRMRSADPHERQMVKRLRNKTGMTHIQVMNLVNLAKKSDYIDVETIISSVAGESRYPTELYEFAKRKIVKRLRQEGSIERSVKDIAWEEEKHKGIYEEWLIGQRRSSLV